MLFRHTWKDGILVLLSLLNLSLMLYVAFAFDTLSWPVLVACGAVNVFLYCTNYQCVAHNFLHNPFFKFELLNNLFSIVNSASLGLPQTLYKYHHLNHHRYNNDAQDPVTHTTQDHSSTYRHTRKPEFEEHILLYSLVGPLRTNLPLLYEEARSHRRTVIVWFEVVGLVAIVGLFLYINPWFGLYYLLPVWFLGQAAALAENYLEHHYAQPGNRLTDSVSCYNGLYNFLWFNNGYHQEHHLRPTVHWTQVRELRSLMLPDSERRVVRIAHIFNFGRGKPLKTETETETERVK